MQTLKLNQKNKLFAAAILLLSVVALILKFFGGFRYNRNLHGHYDYYGRPIEEYVRLNFSIYDAGLYALFLEILPVCLFIIYSLTLYLKKKPAVKIELSYGLMASMYLVTILLRVRVIDMIDYYHDVLYDAITMMNSFDVLNIVQVLVILAFLLLIVFELKNKRTASIITISLTTALFLIEMNLFDHPTLLEGGLLGDVISYYIGNTVFCVALLLFKIKFSKYADCANLFGKKFDRMNPEQALKFLKEKRELDVITEEEYQAQRAEIISRL